jgi:hypothetical protein
LMWSWKNFPRLGRLVSKSRNLFQSPSAITDPTYCFFHLVPGRLSNSGA